MRLLWAAWFASVVYSWVPWQISRHSQLSVSLQDKDNVSGPSVIPRPSSIPAIQSKWTNPEESVQAGDEFELLRARQRGAGILTGPQTG